MLEVLAVHHLALGHVKRLTWIPRLFGDMNANNSHSAGTYSSFSGAFRLTLCNFFGETTDNQTVPIAYLGGTRSL